GVAPAEAGDRGGPEYRWRAVDVPQRPSARAYGRAAAFVAAAGLLAGAATALLPLRDPGLLFLAAVLVSALTSGLGPSIVASILSVIVYDFFFTQPFYSLRM